VKKWCFGVETVEIIQCRGVYLMLTGGVYRYKA
jgi:hypothetical protein